MTFSQTNGAHVDYLMRNTDRGADNYMIKCCDIDHAPSTTDEAPSLISTPQMTELRRSDVPAMPSTSRIHPTTARPAPAKQPHIHIAAIDNSLSFPHEHPKGWRSYTYGVGSAVRCFNSGLTVWSQWLFLPVSIVGQPFSQETRDHFLPMCQSSSHMYCSLLTSAVVTSSKWWEETTYEMRKIFAVDPDFHPKMFAVRKCILCVISLVS
jgi:phosphatidylinositol 4-kinase type 2